MHILNPTFLYESIWDFGVFLILIYVLKKARYDGVTFISYIGLYSAGRFIIEGMRTDSLMLGSFRVAQIVSLLGVIASIILICYIFHKRGMLPHCRDSH